MPFGIQNATSITFDNITYLSNASSLPEFLVKANWLLFDGWFYFIMLCVLWAVLYFAANDNNNQVMHNLMYSGAGVSIISFFFRAIEISVNGVLLGLLTDFQLWVFPISTILLAGIIWATR